MHIVSGGALPHIRANSHLVVGYALHQHEQIHGPRPVVLLDLKGLAWLTHKIATPHTPLPPTITGQLSVLFTAAAERADALPGWRILLDRTARRPRLRCERVLPDAAAPAAVSA